MNQSTTIKFLATVCAAVFFGVGCGSSDGRDSPETADFRIGFDSFLADVGQRLSVRVEDIDDPEGDGLLYTWSKIHPTSDTEFDDRCEGDLSIVCFSNEDDMCLSPGEVIDGLTGCVTNDDCEENGDVGVCIPGSGTTSEDCPMVDGEETGPCALGDGRTSEQASFVADDPGPYTVRLLAETSREATTVRSIRMDTFPSLYIVGSLFALGGTQGGLVGEFADADTFAADASVGISNPATGNILLGITDAGVVREFDGNDGSIIGTFGETGSIPINPVAMAFDAEGDLFVASEDGAVTMFDGATGLFIGNFGDVTTGAQQVAAIDFLANTAGNLIVVDGRAGQALREYGINSGALRGNLGNTGTAVAQAVDVSVDTASGNGTVYIADAAGELVICDIDGTGCTDAAGTAGLLGGGTVTSVAFNPAGALAAGAEVLIGVGDDSVVGCSADGASCAVFGESAGLASAYTDIFFAPPALPTTTTTTTTSTTIDGVPDPTSTTTTSTTMPVM